MRRLIVLVPILALLILAPAACKRKRAPRAGAPDDDGQLMTMVSVADPRAALQLTRGFYDLENNAWRWTAKNFTVMLRRPTGAAQNGANLQLKFTIPDVVFSKIGPIALSATIGGVALPPETYSKAGDFTYAREVPASALPGETVDVNFTADKSLPPSDQDTRELSVVVTTIGLLPK
jgi:hypothetical protein